MQLYNHRYIHDSIIMPYHYVMWYRNHSNVMHLLNMIYHFVIWIVYFEMFKINQVVTHSMYNNCTCDVYTIQVYCHQHFPMWFQYVIVLIVFLFNGASFNLISIRYSLLITSQSAISFAFPIVWMSFYGVYV